MGSRTATAKAGAVAVHDGKAQAEEAGRHEDPPIKVHSDWSVTSAVHWVELDDLFRSQKVRRTLEVLKEMRQRELARRFHPNSG